MCVAEKRELLQIVGLFKWDDKADEAGQVQRERNKPMVGDEDHEEVVLVEQETEFFDETLTVQVVVGCEEKIPADYSEPRKIVWFVDHVADCDYFMEAFELDEKNKQGDCQRSCQR